MGERSAFLAGRAPPDAPAASRAQPSTVPIVACGDLLHVGPRLAVVRHPTAHRLRTGVVGGERQGEWSESVGVASPGTGRSRRRPPRCRTDPRTPSAARGGGQELPGPERSGRGDAVRQEPALHLHHRQQESRWKPLPPLGGGDQLAASGGWPPKRQVGRCSAYRRSASQPGVEMKGREEKDPRPSDEVQRPVDQREPGQQHQRRPQHRPPDQGRRAPIQPGGDGDQSSSSPCQYATSRRNLRQECGIPGS